LPFEELFPVAVGFGFITMSPWYSIGEVDGQATTTRGLSPVGRGGEGRMVSSWHPWWVGTTTTTTTSTTTTTTTAAAAITAAANGDSTSEYLRMVLTCYFDSTYNEAPLSPPPPTITTTTTTYLA